MVIFAALVLAATPAVRPSPAGRVVVAERQAVAMVRILPGAKVEFSRLEKIAPDSFTNAWIRHPDGPREPARLVEFH